MGSDRGLGISHGRQKVPLYGLRIITNTKMANYVFSSLGGFFFGLG